MSLVKKQLFKIQMTFSKDRYFETLLSESPNTATPLRNIDLLTKNRILKETVGQRSGLKKKKKLGLFIPCVWIFCLQLCLCIKCLPGAPAGQKNVGSLATEVTQCCEPLYGCWELNVNPSKEELILLNLEPSLKLPRSTF